MKWKDLPQIVVEANVFKWSVAMDIGYTQPSNKYYHI